MRHSGDRDRGSRPHDVVQMVYSLYDRVNHLVFSAEVRVRRARDARGLDSAALFPVPVVRLVVGSSSGRAATTTPPTGRWTAPVVVGLWRNPVMGPDGRRGPRVPTATLLPPR